MESLRILPLAMFFTGALLVYAGFSDQKPSDIIRNALNGGGGNGGTGQEDLYAPDRNPYYAGVPRSGVNAAGGYTKPYAYGDRGYFA
jgi:hypothetical protein